MIITTTVITRALFVAGIFCFFHDWIPRSEVSWSHGAGCGVRENPHPWCFIIPPGGEERSLIHRVRLYSQSLKLLLLLLLLNDIVSLQYIIVGPPNARNSHIAAEWHHFFSFLSVSLSKRHESPRWLFCCWHFFSSPLIHFCWQAAYFVHGAFVTLSPFACFWHLPL